MRLPAADTPLTADDRLIPWVSKAAQAGRVKSTYAARESLDASDRPPRSSACDRRVGK